MDATVHAKLSKNFYPKKNYCLIYEIKKNALSKVGKLL